MEKNKLFGILAFIAVFATIITFIVKLVNKKKAIPVDDYTFIDPSEDFDDIDVDTESSVEPVFEENQSSTDDEIDEEIKNSDEISF